jgi:hypothetical protein
VATYVVKRAFEWKTLDLGYPSAIAVIWFVIIFGAVARAHARAAAREALEFLSVRRLAALLLLPSSPTRPSRRARTYGRR